MKKRLTIMITILIIIALLFWLIVGLLQHFSVNFIAPIPAARPGTIKVACVGDSTTYGMLIADREKNNYPSQLQKLLGDAYSVRNYAANSTTVLSTGDHPYIHHRVYRLSAEFAPDIVLIMLGSNDAKPENWTTEDAFRADYEALVLHYATLASHPAIYLMTPPSVIPRNGKNAYDINPDVLESICHIIRDVAAEMDLPLIDVYAETAGQDTLFSSLDGTHPNKQGAALIAQQVYASMAPSP